MNTTTPFDSVQRIVLVGSGWTHARHLALRFGENAEAPRFLNLLKRDGLCPTSAAARDPQMQVSLGLSRRGLVNLGVPPHVLACFALKAPAFCLGAQVRAASRLSAADRNSARRWDEAFDFTALDGVLSLHGCDGVALTVAEEKIRILANQCGGRTRPFAQAQKLEKAPDGETQVPDASWVHFGYRDGLSRIGIRGWTSPAALDQCRPASLHAAGEFVLGHPQDSGANPWIAGPGMRTWPEELRSFFRNASFGVLHQIEQHVEAFEKFVANSAQASGMDARELKAKLCGRHPDGRPLGAPEAGPLDDFDYKQDPHGYGCPFGAHVRRLNPRDETLAQSFRSRALIRRGMPYGPAWSRMQPRDGIRRGLMAQFFCASIEDQFEHLVGQWAERVPMGSADRGTARDPLVGAHEAGDGPFEIPRGNRSRPVTIDGMRPFVRTVGVAYLFYPSLTTFDGIAANAVWFSEEEDA
jgi:deferrochelatase/peroxidase EfeB